ncbi:MAG: ribonuclease HI [Planctomycetia bacterium]|jgi:ribonuclease HI
MIETEVILYTDGACSGNPGPGGWGFVLRHPASGKEIEQSGGEPETTNNRMEMMAVIRGLETLNRPTSVELVSDSSYVGQGISSWMANWKKNGWRRKSKNGWAEVKNVDLWKRLDELLQTHTVKFTHVRGHSGHPENERCDELAVAAYQKYLN